MKIITEIKWNITDDVSIYDSEKCDLPNELELPDGITEDEIADRLSNEYGFLVESFTIQD